MNSIEDLFKEWSGQLLQVLYLSPSAALNAVKESLVETLVNLMVPGVDATMKAASLLEKFPV